MARRKRVGRRSPSAPTSVSINARRSETAALPSGAWNLGFGALAPKARWGTLPCCEFVSVSQVKRMPGGSEKDIMEKMRRALRLDGLPPQVRRIVVMIVGGTILLLGVAMIVLPGPAIIVIPVGL